MKLKVDKEIYLMTLDEGSGKELFELTSENRKFLKEWLPWLDFIKTIEDSKKFIIDENIKWSQRKGLTFGVFYRENLVGLISYNSLEKEIGQIGYWLGKEYNSLGIMRKSVTALVEYGFSELNLKKIEIRVATENNKSLNIPIKLGFKREKIRKKAENLYGTWVDHIVCGIYKNQWRSKRMRAKDRVIVALDFPTLEEAKGLVTTLGDKIDIYKVGLEMFLNSKGEAVNWLHEQGKKVFLDLKFHDIPNTTTMASLFAAKQDVFMFNVHAGGGKKMMTSVADMLKEQGCNSIAIAVTVLTSFTEEEITEHFATDKNIQELARHWALATKESGMHGVVCSPLEAKSIKELCGEEFKTVCPGVRPAWAAANDQKRIMTPKMAVENGADFLVIGRPITKAENPVEAAEKIVSELEG